MTIFDVATEHASRYGAYSGGATFCLLVAGRILAHEQLPPVFLVVAYLLLAVAVRYIAAAAVYTGYTIWAAGSMLPPVYNAEFNVDGSDLPLSRPDLDAAAGQRNDHRHLNPSTPVRPLGQPVRAAAPSVTLGEGDGESQPRPQRNEFISGAAIGVVARPDVFEDYPDIEVRVMQFIADRVDTVFSGRKLGEAGVVSRDSRVMPNGSVVIDSLARAGIVRTIGNQQFILTEAGKSLVMQGV